LQPDLAGQIVQVVDQRDGDLPDPWVRRRLHCGQGTFGDLLTRRRGPLSGLYRLTIVVVSVGCPVQARAHVTGTDQPARYDAAS
jgi:hypothetical protein